jgi:AraC-like DNA-binding protein
MPTSSAELYSSEGRALGVIVMERASRDEWSQFYRLAEPGTVEVLHARFVAHRYPRHAHDHFVIGLVERGAQSYWYRGARHITPAGQIFLVNPDEPHTGEAATPAGYVYRTLYPRVDFLARVAEDIGSRARVPFFSQAVLNDPLLATLLSRFHQSIAKRSPRVEQEARLLEALARLLVRHADPQVVPRPVGRERPAVRKVREYMETNFAQGLSLAELAGLVSLSPYYFARAFAREVGLPPHTYLEGVRIRKAAERLDRGERIASAALAVGYSDQSHFNRRFKQFLGITPGQYLREARRHPNAPADDSKSMIIQDKSVPPCEHDPTPTGVGRVRGHSETVRTAGRNSHLRQGQI